MIKDERIEKAEKNVQAAALNAAGWLNGALYVVIAAAKGPDGKRETEQLLSGSPYTYRSYSRNCQEALEAVSVAVAVLEETIAMVDSEQFHDARMADKYSEAE